MERTVIEMEVASIPQHVLLDPRYKSNDVTGETEDKVAALFSQHKARVDSLSQTPSPTKYFLDLELLLSANVQKDEKIQLARTEDSPIDGLRKQYVKLEQLLEDKLEIIEDLRSQLSKTNKQKYQLEQLQTEYNRLNAAYKQLLGESKQHQEQPSPPLPLKCDCAILINQLKESERSTREKAQTEKEYLRKQVEELKNLTQSLKEQLQNYERRQRDHSKMVSNSTTLTTKKTSQFRAWDENTLSSKEQDNSAYLGLEHRVSGLVSPRGPRPTDSEGLIYELGKKDARQENYKREIIRLRDQLAEHQIELTQLQQQNMYLENQLSLVMSRRDQSKTYKDEIYIESRLQIEKLLDELAAKDILIDRLTLQLQENRPQGCRSCQHHCCRCTLKEVKKELRLVERSEMRELKKVLSSMDLMGSTCHSNESFRKYHELD